MQDNALAVSKTNRTPREIDKKLRVGNAVKRAIEAMVWQGLDYAAAAKEAGITTRAMRLAMGKPHVVQYLNAEKQVLRSSAGPRNIQRLMQIRDAADNMPAVNAIKALEEIGSDAAISSQRQSAPGIVFIINDRNATVAVDDGTVRKTIAGDVIKSSE